MVSMSSKSSPRIEELFSIRVITFRNISLLLSVGGLLLLSLLALFTVLCFLPPAVDNLEQDGTPWSAVWESAADTVLGEIEVGAKSSYWSSG